MPELPFGEAKPHMAGAAAGVQTTYQQSDNMAGTTLPGPAFIKSQQNWVCRELHVRIFLSLTYVSPDQIGPVSLTPSVLWRDAFAVPLQPGPTFTRLPFPEQQGHHTPLCSVPIPCIYFPIPSVLGSIQSSIRAEWNGVVAGNPELWCGKETFERLYPVNSLCNWDPFPSSSGLSPHSQEVESCTDQSKLVSVLVQRGRCWDL